MQTGVATHMVDSMLIRFPRTSAEARSLLTATKTDWRCAGCGVPTPGPLKVCECLTPSVYDAANRDRIDSRLQTVWKAIVCGGRNFLDKSLLFATLDELDVRHVIEGGATGADALAREWAQQRFRPFTEYPANWMAQGRGAGPRRNAAMLEENPDAVVAFPGGRGTDHIIALAAGRGVPIVRPQDVGRRV